KGEEPWRNFKSNISNRRFQIPYFRSENEIYLSQNFIEPLSQLFRHVGDRIQSSNCRRDLTLLVKYHRRGQLIDAQPFGNGPIGIAQYSDLISAAQFAQLVIVGEVFRFGRIRLSAHPINSNSATRVL